MADTGAGADPRKACVGDDCHFATPTEVFEGRRDLVGFFHACPKWSATNQHDDVAGDDLFFALTFDGAHGITFAQKHLGRTDFAIYPIVTHHPRIDGGTFDD